MDLAFTTAIDMAAALGRGDYTSAEATESILGRIEAVNPRINAYLTVAAEQAMDAARTADARRARGGYLPPFLGVPISIKDLSNTAGIRTTHGTRAWADRVPDTDDEIVTRIKGAGFVILGKTNTPEFGQSVVSEPPGYPPARNPWNTDLTPGGSSGGAAAAVAAGLGPVAQGSDTGGSVRIPSSLCGVVGLRPSRGRISAAPKAMSLHTTHGPIARTVADCAALLDAMVGPAVGDDFTGPVAPRPFVDEVQPPARALRVAFSAEPFMLDIEASPAHQGALLATAKQLEELGHQVVEAAPPWDPTIVEASLAMFAAEMAADAGAKPPVEQLDGPSQMLITTGATITAVEYLQVKERIRQQALGVHRFFGDWDVLVTPTVPVRALPVGAFGPSDQPPDLETLMQFRALTAFTALCTYTGVPGLSLPLATDDEGLPIGLQFMSRTNHEATLLSLGRQLELAVPWADRTPPVGT